MADFTLPRTLMAPRTATTTRLPRRRYAATGIRPIPWLPIVTVVTAGLYSWNQISRNIDAKSSAIAITVASAVAASCSAPGAPPVSARTRQ